MNRAWSIFNIKSFEDDERTFEGVASTLETDRMGDIVEPKGAKYKLPIPVLFQHGKGANPDPIGWVTSAKVTEDAIFVKGRLAKLDSPPSLKEDLDRAWALMKSKLVRGFSIGFRPIESEPIKGTAFAERFTEWEWLELSPVAIPANASATITTVKSIDTSLRAASGMKRSDVVRLDPVNPSGVSEHTKGNAVTTAEQITQFENKRAAHEGRMSEIMTKAEGRTLEESEVQEYDGLKADVESIDKHLVRLRDHEKTIVARAQRVTATAVADPVAAAAVRNPNPVIEVRSMAPKGILPARMAIAMYKGGNVPEVAAQIAKRLWPDNPEVEMVLRTGVDAGDTTTSGWASQLVPAAQQMMNEFLEMLRAQTILGRIPGLRRVPFNIAVPIQTGTGTYGWVGEAAGKPVTSLTFSSVTLRWAKAAGIIVITEELARFSTPSAEMIIRDDMLAGLTRFFDTQFIGTAAAVTNVSPAGILNGITPVVGAPSSTTPAAFRSDMYNMLNNFTANNQDVSQIVLLMSATQAIALSLMNTDLGVSLFPNIGINGGTVLGLPVIVSEAVGTKIIALIPNQILLASDGAIRVDVSREASVEMETNPAVGEQSPLSTLTNLKSLWQNNLVGFRCEMYQVWLRGRDSAVEYINGNAYVPS